MFLLEFRVVVLEEGEVFTPGFFDDALALDQNRRSGRISEPAVVLLFGSSVEI